MRNWLAVFVALFASAATLTSGAEAVHQRLLYVATPGIRDYMDYGGHGLLVFDIDRGHQFVRRIPTGGMEQDGKPINVKGICASAKTKRIHISSAAWRWKDSAKAPSNDTVVHRMELD